MSEIELQPKRAKSSNEVEKLKKETEIKLIDYIARNYPDKEFQEINTKAPNADNLQEAILCYLQYGEYAPEEIWI